MKIYRYILPFVVLFFIVDCFALGYFLFFREKKQVNSILSSVQNQIKAETSEVLPLDNFNLTLDQQIGQLLVTVPQGQKLSNQEIMSLQTATISGYFLLGKNIDSREQLQQLNKSIYQSATSSALTPFLAVDQEGGNVQRISWLDTTSQVQLSTPSAAFSVAAQRVLDLKNLGFNLDFAPVVEYVYNQESFIVNQARNFPNNDSNLRISMVSGMNSGGIIPVVKHFPSGLGFITQDPHLTLPSVSQEAKDLEPEFKMYKDLIDIHIPLIMVTHLIYPKIDSKPTSQSKVFLQDILRAQLGFTGLIFTDDLSMGAVKNYQEVGEYAVESLLAGSDVLLVSNEADLIAVRESIYKSVSKDKLKKGDLQAKVERILEFKRRL